MREDLPLGFDVVGLQAERLVEAGEVVICKVIRPLVVLSFYVLDCWAAGALVCLQAEFH